MTSYLHQIIALFLTDKLFVSTGSSKPPFGILFYVRKHGLVRLERTVRMAHKIVILLRLPLYK